MKVSCFAYFILFVIVFDASLSAAEELSVPAPPADPYAGLLSFNGYKLADFPEFEKWRLVTVRFRKDSGELRFVYANSLAWASLRKGGNGYQDGSVFAKVAVTTQPDPSFESSAVPAGTERIQFMVKDSRRHQEQGGWGYAIFDRQGKTFPGDPKTARIACHACHKLVPERGYVFSQPMQKPLISSAALRLSGKVAFETIGPATLPLKIRALLPPGTKELSRVSGLLGEHLFAGTLDEIRPSLAVQVISTGKPALLSSRDHRMFSLVVVEKGIKECAGKSALVSYVRSSGKSERIQERHFCY